MEKNIAAEKAFGNITHLFMREAFITLRIERNFINIRKVNQANKPNP